MKNITLSIKENVENFAKIKAASEGKSLSRYINDLLVQLMNRENNSDLWAQDFLSQEPYVKFESQNISREELYDRKVLR